MLRLYMSRPLRTVRQRNAKDHNHTFLSFSHIESLPLTIYHAWMVRAVATRRSCRRLMVSCLVVSCRVVSGPFHLHVACNVGNVAAQLRMACCVILIKHRCSLLLTKITLCTVYFKSSMSLQIASSRFT